MQALRHPHAFLTLAAKHAPTRAAARACGEGNYSLPVRRKWPWGNQGWTFTVWSLRRGKWSVSIEVLEDERRYQVKWRKL